MPFTRRQFLQTAAAASAAAASSQVSKAQRVPQLDPNTLPKFVDPLPIPPVAKPIATASKAGGSRYRIAMRQTEAKLHPRSACHQIVDLRGKLARPYRRDAQRTGTHGRMGQ